MIAAIRAALHKHGYQIRKRPKQEAWTITPLNPPKTAPPLARGLGKKLTPPLATGTEEKLTPPLLRGAGGDLKSWLTTHNVREQEFCDRLTCHCSGFLLRTIPL
jgi:hypothetical protein